jgi:hypothetical protein
MHAGLGRPQTLQVYVVVVVMLAFASSVFSCMWSVRPSVNSLLSFKGVFREFMLLVENWVRRERPRATPLLTRRLQGVDTAFQDTFWRKSQLRDDA